jgi:hypothetical protein
MTELDEDLDQRLGRARLGLSSTLDARARVRARLAARGAFSPAGAAGGALETARRGVPALVSAALVVASFAAGYWLRDVRETERRLEAVVEQTASPSDDARRPAADQPPPAMRSPEPSHLLSDAVPSAHREPKPAPPTARRRRRDELPARAAENPANAPTTSGELALLRRAERAIRAGDPALALILLDQLERTHPKSALGEERTAARILVECARSGELAKPEAARFLEKHPSSVYSDRIVRACRLEASGISESSADVRSSGH